MPDIARPARARSPAMVLRPATAGASILIPQARPEASSGQTYEVHFTVPRTVRAAQGALLIWRRTSGLRAPCGGGLGTWQAVGAPEAQAGRQVVALRFAGEERQSRAVLVVFDGKIVRDPKTGVALDIITSGDRVADALARGWFSAEEKMITFIVGRDGSLKAETLSRPLAPPRRPSDKPDCWLQLPEAMEGRQLIRSAEQDRGPMQGELSSAILGWVRWTKGIA